MKVLNRIKKCTINDKDEIINIMNECKWKKFYVNKLTVRSDDSQCTWKK
jgi:hypothetical protein